MKNESCPLYENLVKLALGTMSSFNAAILEAFNYQLVINNTSVALPKQDYIYLIARGGKGGLECTKDPRNNTITSNLYLNVKGLDGLIWGSVMLVDYFDPSSVFFRKLQIKDALNSTVLKVSYQAPQIITSGDIMETLNDVSAAALESKPNSVYLQHPSITHTATESNFSTNSSPYLKMSVAIINLKDNASIICNR